jgi:hypothetical protein
VKLTGVCGVNSPTSGQGPVAGSCEHGDESSCSGATELVCHVSFQVSRHVAVFNR